MREVMKKGVGLAFMLFVLLLFVPSRAYAADNMQWRYDGVVYGPEWVSRLNYPVDSNAQQWVIVNAPDKFSAAVYACGGNPFDLTSDQKALLSNSSTGGDFYQFSLHFVNIGGSFDRPDWFVSGDNSRWIQGVYRDYADLYGEDDLYIAAFTPAERNGAYAQYDLIKDGGNLGGGGGSGSTYTLQRAVSKWAGYTGVSATYQGMKLSDGSKLYPKDYPATAKLQLDYGNVSTIESLVNSGHDVVIRLLGNSNAENLPYYQIDYYDSGTLSQMDTHYYSNLNLTYDCVKYAVTGSRLLHDTTGTNRVTSAGYSDGLTFNGHVGVYTHGTMNTTAGDYAWTFNIKNDGSIDYSGYFLILYADGTTSYPQTPPIPETNWPDDDSVLPTPPDLPEPQSTTIDEQPVQPTPQPDGSYPSYTVVSVNNFTADIQGILDAMDEHCEHLQEALWWNFNNFWQKISTKMTNDFATLRTFLSQQFGWIVDSIDKMFESLKDYLEDLAEWLRDELDYIIGGSAYDDNTLLSWLRKIYYKLGNGNVSTKPVDPVSNPDGVGDWISQLLQNLFTALDDLAGGLLTSLATLLGGLVTKFPFSIPWDVAAILGLLVAEPVAPAIEFPVYTLSAGELTQVGTIDIDMDAWTPYLTGIHMMIRVSFILFLMLKTKDFMTIMEKAVGLDA